MHGISIGDAARESEIVHSNKFIIVIPLKFPQPRPPQQVFHTESKLSFSYGIDDRVTQRTD